MDADVRPTARLAMAKLGSSENMLRHLAVHCQPQHLHVGSSIFFDPSIKRDVSPGWSHLTWVLMG